MKPVPFVDLGAQHRPLREEMLAAVARVLDHSGFVLGAEVERFERAVAAKLGVAEAIGVSCGTDALIVALLAAGVRAGDVVLTTPLSFVATAEAIRRVGAAVRFVDLDGESLGFDLRQLEEALREGARAVVPVHLYGRCVRVPEVLSLCRRFGAKLIEDAAQAFGTRASGQAAGTFGLAGCFSFFPTKVLGALGDGGLVVTSDAGFADRCRELRQHGLSQGRAVTLGGNFRLDAIQAAALLVQLAHVDAWIAARRRHAAAYDEALAAVPGIRIWAPPDEGWNGALYTILVPEERRDELRDFLGHEGIETRVYYPVPLHREPVFEQAGHPARSLAVAESLSRRVLSLPNHPGLDEEQRSRVIQAVRAFFER